MPLFQKLKYIFMESTPLILMIICIPFIGNDWMLTLLYVGISGISFGIKSEGLDILIYLVGFFAMLLSETFFITTGVEVFQRVSLFGIMPVWLPFLWAYGFIVIRRSIHIIEI